MLHMICGKTLRDGISNEPICEMAGMEKIENFLRKQSLAMVWACGKVGSGKSSSKSKKF